MTRDKRGKDACPSAPLPAGAIEDYVVERLRDAVRDAELVGDVTESVKARVAERRDALLAERMHLPVAIARLSAEGKRMVEKVGAVGGGADRLLDERLEEVGAELARCEARLAEVEREIVGLDAVEVESEWVATCLEDFDGVWDVLTPENRGRLLRAVVEKVEVDEPAGRVRAFLARRPCGRPCKYSRHRGPGHYRSPSLQLTNNDSRCSLA